MTKMKIETGHSVTKNVVAVDGYSVRFVAEDGRTMFEVTAGDDGRSIEIRGVDVCVVRGVMYASLIDVRPNVSNSVSVMARRYDER
jgi:hypothetical protein